MVQGRGGKENHFPHHSRKAFSLTCLFFLNWRPENLEIFSWKLFSTERPDPKFRIFIPFTSRRSSIWLIPIKREKLPWKRLHRAENDSEFELVKAAKPPRSQSRNCAKMFPSVEHHSGETFYRFDDQKEGMNLSGESQLRRGVQTGHFTGQFGPRKVCVDCQGQRC